MPGRIARSERLHPEARALLEAMDAQKGEPIPGQDPIEVRTQSAKRFKTLGGESEPLARVEDFLIPGPAGEVPARLYASEPDGRCGTLIYFHGGGWVIGSVETHDAVCRSLAKESGCAVISVDYRLAPEHKFPAAVEDGHAATTWIAANAMRLGIDAGRITVGGDSAGGNLATVIALRCCAGRGPALAGQVLIYPVIDLTGSESASYREFGEGYYLGRDEMAWFAGQYLPSPELAHSPEVSPLLAQDLHRLPPTLVITAEFDPLRDDGEAYAERLREARVAVTLTRYPGMIHGFMAMRGVLSAGRQAIREVAGFLRERAAAVKLPGGRTGAAPQD